MICAIDIETQGLDATKYITGCLLIHRGKKLQKPEIYRTKQALWNRVLELNLAEAKRGKTLTIYSHNASFDTAGYVNLQDRHLVFFSNKPFIWAYRMKSEECDKEKIPHTQGKGRETTKFLDTMALYGMSLADVGKLIGLEKAETPKELYDETRNVPYSEQELTQIEKYMVQDTAICLASVLKLQQTCRENNVAIKRLYTINQIANNYMMTELSRLPDSYLEPLFWNKKKREVRRTFRATEIHAAYKGGRVEAFQTGIFNENVYGVDCNQLYGYAETMIRMPDLRTERIYHEPLKTGWTKKELLSSIGVHRCIMKNISCGLGLLSIRTDIGNYCPKPGTVLIGTWTDIEINYALENGYELYDIEWSVLWQETPNPFKLITPKLYDRRKLSAFDDFFCKRVINNSIGKMAQRKTGQEIVIDSVELCESYLERSYKVLKGIDLSYMYVKEDVNAPTKPYYMPIVPCLINSWARVYMFGFFKQIPKRHLLYTDTDSCLTLGDWRHIFPLGTELGQFKTIKGPDNKPLENSNAIIYGRKTYDFGGMIKISGISKKGLSSADFEDGFVSSKKMVTIKTTKNLAEVGTFVTETRDLKKQGENHNAIMHSLGQEKILIDSDVLDISYFAERIKKLSKHVIHYV